MIAEYKRDLNRKYLELKKYDNDYQVEMIIKNSTKGFVEITQTSWNGEESLLYDITGKQTIERVFSKRKIGFEEIAGILYSISAMVDECCRLLISEESVIMDPQFIYWDYNKDKPCWIFYPYDKEAADICILSEFILEHVDNDDSKAVKASYELYKRVKEGSIKADSLFELIMGDELQKSEDKIIEVLNNVNEQITKDSAKPGHKTEDKRVLYEFDNDGISNQKPSVFDNMIKRIKMCIGKNKEENYDEVYKIGMNEDNINEREDRFLQESSSQTVFIDLDSQSGHRLISRDDRINDEKLEFFPCVFGSRRDCVDVLINDKSVSRMHAQIDIQNGHLYLSDLESTNGTFLNGKKLTNTECEIFPGDEISFGSVKYLLT